jgi:hypothetical protein
VLTPAAYVDQVEESEHLVQFYEDEGFLLDGTARFISAGLAVGDTLVCIATEAHGRGIEERLWAAGHDVAAARGEGRYVSWDAAEILARLLVEGWPDEHRFREIVGEVIARAADSSRPRRVRVFGEMVALLCLEGTPEAAIRLEELWNGLADALPFTLLCATPCVPFQRLRTETPSRASAPSTRGFVPPNPMGVSTRRNDSARSQRYSKR